MAEVQRLVKFLNPWALHLQKLGLELKCPFCLNLLTKPVLLPCNHFFCHLCVPRSTQLATECPECKNQCADREIRSAPYMENLVTIYRSLDASYGNTILQLLSSEQASVSGSPPNFHKFKMEPSETPEVGLMKTSEKVPLVKTNEQGHSSPNACDKDRNWSTENRGKGVTLSRGQNKELEQLCGHKMDLNGNGRLVNLQLSSWKRTNEGNEIEDMDMNQGPQKSPESPPSFGDGKDMNGNIDAAGSRCGSTEKCKTKISVDYLLDATVGDMHLRALQGGTCNDARDAKRQKLLNYRSSQANANVKGNGLTEEQLYNSDSRAISNCILAPKPKEHLYVPQKTPVSDSSELSTIVCAFCHSSKITDATGSMLYYAHGKEVDGRMASLSGVIPVHTKCIEWAPRVYYEGETIKNLESEVGRAAKLKCSSCGQKGAALGCFAKSCRRTYHVLCAFKIEGCRWDCEDFLMLCPNHNSFKFPRENSKSGKSATRLKQHPSSDEMSITNSNFWAMSPIGPKEWVFCGSALSSEEKYILLKFATMCGANVSKFWKPNVTHVIAAIDEKGACTRTLKVLMGILEGRWIISMDWIKACMEANRPVNEEPYEVCLDNHGCLNGPKTGRLRFSNNEPRLFHGLKFYFSGDFVPAYKVDLLDLVRAAGGAILESVEQLMIQSHNVRATFTECLVVYNDIPARACAMGEDSSFLPRRLAEADKVANETNSLVCRHTWILESIAACKLLPFCG